MARPIIFSVFGIVMVFLAYHAYKANGALGALEAEKESLSASLSSLAKDSKKIEGDIDYFSDSRNLEKELRARFNYRAPNEKMMIVVPPKSGE